MHAPGDEHKTRWEATMYEKHCLARQSTDHGIQQWSPQRSHTGAKKERS